MNLVSSIQQCTSPITTRALVDHTLFSTELSSRSSHRNGPTMVQMWGRARSPSCSTRSQRWSRRTVFKYSCWTETSPALSHQCVVCCLFVFYCCLFVFYCCLFVCCYYSLLQGTVFWFTVCVTRVFCLFMVVVVVLFVVFCCLFTIFVYSVTPRNCFPPPPLPRVV